MLYTIPRWAIAPITILSSNIGLWLTVSPASAQITPDTTLGRDSTRVVQTRIRNQEGTRIDGGAIRGSNLFHSFVEFNIGEAQGAYFTNPAGIETILGRVTGTDVSDIFGTLGVLGDANLFLLNPNGFVFGENATLDIRGSFVASTADRFNFPDGSHFSAVNPNQPPMLTIALSPGLQYGTNYQGPIDNTAALTVTAGQTLSLAGTVTTNTGILTAPGGTVQVLGNQVNLLEFAHIDVSSPQGGGDIFVGGNLRGNGNLPNAQRTVVGSGVVLQADALTTGNGGQVVVWAEGVTQFYGTISAQGGIQSGNGGFAEVSGKQRLVFNGQANLSASQGLLGTLLLDPTNIIIVDGNDGLDDMDLINDNEILTEDDPGATFTISELVLEGLAGDANVVLEATNDIIINDLTDDELSLAAGTGSVTFTADANANGAGSFTMLDPNDSILSGGRDITITGTVITPGTINSEGGDITLTASDRLVLDGIEFNSGDFTGSTFTGFSGDIELSAGNDITLRNALVTSDGGGVGAGGSEDAGDINVQSTNGSISLERSEVSSSAENSGFAGDIVIVAGDRIDIRNNSTVFSDANNDNGGNFGGEGGAGFITITATNDVVIASGSRINAENIGASEDAAGGNISITTQQRNITFDNAALSTNAESSGFAGDIMLSAENGSISLTNMSRLDSNFESNGFNDNEGGAGTIEIMAQNDITIASGSTISAESFGTGEDSTASNISLTTQQGSISLDRAELATNVEGSGFAGDIVLTSGDRIDIRNSTLVSDADNDGNDDFSAGGGAGFIEMTAANDVAIADNSNIRAISFNGGVTGNSGNINIESQQRSISLENNVELTTSVEGNGFAGDIELTAENGEISLFNSSIVSDLNGFEGTDEGGAGFIRLRAGNDISLEGSAMANNNGNNLALRTISASSFGNATNAENRGSIRIRSSNGSVRATDAQIIATASGEDGTAGDIRLLAEEEIVVTNDSRIRSDAEGTNSTGGVVRLHANDTRGRITVENSRLRSDAQGTAGDILLIAEEAIAVTNDSRIRSDAIGTNSEGGSVSLRANATEGLITVDNSRLRSDATGQDATGGEVIIQAGDRITIRNNAIVQSDASGSNNAQNAIRSGAAGSVNIIAPVEILVQNSRVTSTSENANTSDTDQGEDFGNVTLRSRQGIITLDGATVSTTNEGSAFAGDINLDAPDAILINSSGISSNGFDGRIVIGQAIAPDMLEIENSTLSTTNSSFPDGDSGSTTLNAGNLFITDSTLSSNTSGSGNGGAISLNVGRLLTLDNSRINSEVSTNGPTVSASRSRTGAAQRVENSQSSLQTQATVSTSNTSFGDGGNITLTLPLSSGLVVLENASRISTNAGSVPQGSSGANGGDISISANVIAAELSGNNDITANSVNNNGGIVIINAPGGIFGLIERTREDLIELLGTDDESALDPIQLPTSDITAISQSGSGLSGEIVLNTPDVDPSRGNIELPTAFEETPTLASACSARLDANAARRSEFVLTGRGGLPTDPDDPIDGSRPTTPWVDRGLSDVAPSSESGSLHNMNALPEQSARRPVADTSLGEATSHEPTEIIEAQGWITNHAGHTVLIAQAPNTSTSQPMLLHPSCVSHSDSHRISGKS